MYGRGGGRDMGGGGVSEAWYCLIYCLSERRNFVMPLFIFSSFIKTSLDCDPQSCPALSKVLLNCPFRLLPRSLHLCLRSFHPLTLECRWEKYIFLTFFHSGNFSMYGRGGGGGIWGGVSEAWYCLIYWLSERRSFCYATFHIFQLYKNHVGLPPSALSSSL